MVTDKTYLKYLINEDLYLVDEAQKVRAVPEVKENRSEYDVVGSDADVIDTLIVFDNIKEKETTTFKNIISAIKVQNHNCRESLDLSSKPNRCLVFGNALDVEKYSIQEVEGVSVLRSDPISKLDEDEQLKRKLWPRLKEMFLEV